MLHAYEIMKSVTRRNGFYYITFLADNVTVKVRIEQIYQLAEETWVSADAIRVLLAILEYSRTTNSRNVKKKLPKLQEYEVNGTLAILLDKYAEEILLERLWFMKYADIVAIFKAESPCDKFNELI